MSSKIAPTASLLQAPTEQKEQQVGVKPVSSDSMGDYAIRRDSDAGALPSPINPVVSKLPQCFLNFRGLYA
jgi:hypothetical protein